MKVVVKDVDRLEKEKSKMFKDTFGNIVILDMSDDDSVIVITEDGLVETRMADDYSIFELTPFQGSVTLTQD